MTSNKISSIESEEESEEHSLYINRSISSVRTFCIFLDLPKHIEFRVDGIPSWIQEGEIVNFNITIKGTKDPLKIIKVDGYYKLVRKLNKFVSEGRLAGFSQYLEWNPTKVSP